MSDLISRNDAVEAIEFEKVYITAYKGSSNGYVSEGNLFTQYNKGLDDAIKAINNLAPAEPERTAKVVNKEIDYRDDEYEHDRLGGQFQKGKCGICKHRVIEEFDFCPSCGVRLEWE